MKKWFLNAASDRSKRKRLTSGGGTRLTNPDGEVMSIGELVRMMERGQDVSPFQRNATWGLDTTDDEPDHEQVDLQGFQNLDFAERVLFAREHADSLRELQKDIDNALSREKELEKKPTEVVSPTTTDVKK